MLAFTYWLNLLHPGRCLPRQKERYLDLDGRTERWGPGWIDRRSLLESVLDPFEFSAWLRGTVSHDEYWLRPHEWEVCDDGSFAVGTASNAHSAKSKKGMKPVPIDDHV